jgi:hypothetical protein
MKLKELRQLIRESIQEVLLESYGDGLKQFETDNYHFNNRNSFDIAVKNINKYYKDIDVGHFDMIISLPKGSKIVDKFGVSADSYKLIDEVVQEILMASPMESKHFYDSHRDIILQDIEQWASESMTLTDVALELGWDEESAANNSDSTLYGDYAIHIAGNYDKYIGNLEEIEGMIDLRNDVNEEVYKTGVDSSKFTTAEIKVKIKQLEDDIEASKKRNGSDEFVQSRTKILNKFKDALNKTNESVARPKRKFLRESIDFTQLQKGQRFIFTHKYSGKQLTLAYKDDEIYSGQKLYNFKDVDTKREYTDTKYGFNEKYDIDKLPDAETTRKGGGPKGPTGARGPRKYYTNLSDKYANRLIKDFVQPWKWELEQWGAEGSADALNGGLPYSKKHYLDSIRGFFQDNGGKREDSIYIWMKASGIENPVQYLFDEMSSS